MENKSIILADDVITKIKSTLTIVLQNTKGMIDQFNNIFNNANNSIVIDNSDYVLAGICYHITQTVNEICNIFMEGYDESVYSCFYVTSIDGKKKFEFVILDKEKIYELFDEIPSDEFVYMTIITILNNIMIKK